MVEACHDERPCIIITTKAARSATSGKVAWDAELDEDVGAFVPPATPAAAATVAIAAASEPVMMDPCESSVTIEIVAVHWVPSKL